MPPVNLAVLQGTLSKTPEPRLLADGRTIWELDVSVRPAEGPATTVPVSWAGSPSGLDPSRWAPGEELMVIGSVRRRFYRLGGATVSRTDVLAERVVPVRQRKRAAALVADALTVLQVG